MDASELWSWVVAHDAAIALLSLWLIVNVGPRPHPERLTGPAKAFWLVVDRLCVLTAERVPGQWKWLFEPSPMGSPAAPRAPAPLDDELDESGVVAVAKPIDPEPPKAA